MPGQQGSPRRGHERGEALEEGRRLGQHAVAAALPGSLEPVELGCREGPELVDTGLGWVIGQYPPAAGLLNLLWWIELVTPW